MKLVSTLVTFAVISAGTAFGNDAPNATATEKSVGTEIKETASDAATAVQTGVNKVLGSTRAVVDFDKASATIKAGQKRDLVALIDGLKGNVSAQKVYVVSYSDKDYAADTKYDKTDVSLATKRANAVKNELKKLHVKGDVKVVTLTEAPSAVGKVAKTWESSLKQAVAGQVPEDASVSPVAEEIRSAGGANKVVVLIEQPESVKK